MTTRSGYVYDAKWVPVKVNSAGSLSRAGSYPANVDLSAPNMPQFSWLTYCVPIPSSTPMTQPLYQESTLLVFDNRNNPAPTQDLTVMVMTNDDGYMPVNVPISLNGAPLAGNAVFNIPGHLDSATVANLNSQVNALWAAAGQTRPY